MNTLPLFYYQTTKVLVDDDQLLLDALKLECEKSHPIKTFNSAQKAKNFFNNYQSPLSKYHFLEGNTDDDFYADARHTPVDFDVTKIVRIANDTDKRNDISVMVVDYSMPNLNGLELSEAIKNLPLMKVLLTGRATYNEAIDGFNKGLIDRFIQKGKLDMSELLAECLINLSLEYFRKQTAALLSHLEAARPLPLSDKAYINFFKEYCKKNAIIEFYLADKEGSMLCVDENKKEYIVAIHTDYSLDKWLDVYAEDLTTEQESKIRSRLEIPYFSHENEFSNLSLSERKKFFYPAKIIMGNQSYYYHIIEKELQTCLNEQKK